MNGLSPEQESHLPSTWGGVGRLAVSPARVAFCGDGSDVEERRMSGPWRLSSELLHGTSSAAKVSLEFQWEVGSRQRCTG